MNVISINVSIEKNVVQLDTFYFRLAQFDISGTLVGSKSAAVSMDARSAKADPSNLLRKVVVVRLKGKLDINKSKLVEN